MSKYAAKLLFQFRILIEAKSNKMRRCEEKIVLISAKNAESAYKIANKRGKEDENTYLNDEGNTVYFEFIGIEDLMHIGIECKDDEVWYEIKSYLEPKENKHKFIPNKSNLSAFRYEKK